MMAATQSERAEAIISLATAQQLIRQPSTGLTPQEVAALIEFTEDLEEHA